MGTGENSGTWGTITNTNLGTAIEEAIVGSADVNFSSADVTLTLTDANSSQTARNLRLNLTGTVGAPQNLIVPAIEKVYIINNGLTQTITVKNTGGTGIAVPAGKTMYVYNNGTNVLDAVTHLTSLTLGSALPIASGGTGSTSTTYANLQSNVTGVLPVANGGTGSSSATFSGANITSLNATAVSSGTLDNARTTAASANGASTIVARDASGNFTANVATLTTVTGAGSGLTSLNAANISSGTLAVGRGGTGITSVGTSGNVLTSDGSVWTSTAIPAPTIADGSVTDPKIADVSGAGTAWAPFSDPGATLLDIPSGSSTLTEGAEFRALRSGTFRFKFFTFADNPTGSTRTYNYYLYKNGVLAATISPTVGAGSFAEVWRTFPDITLSRGDIITLYGQQAASGTTMSMSMGGGYYGTSTTTASLAMSLSTFNTGSSRYEPL